MNWRIINENKRSIADKSYFLKAEKVCEEGKIILKVSWIQGMYGITAYLYSKRKNRKWSFIKINNPQLIYSCFVLLNDRVEKYGHQIMRMTDESTTDKFKRLDRLQKDAVLNCELFNKHNIEIKTTLPERR